MTNPFAPWGDMADYFVVPGGDFEHGAPGWTLGAGAAVVAGNEHFYVGGSDDASSLSLPSGSSATSGALCIGPEHPTMRFFAKRTAGGASSVLTVDLLYTTGSGRQIPVRIGRVSGKGDWAPSAVLDLVDEWPYAADASFRFTPSAGSAWRIDDVYVDPIRKG